MAKKTKEFGIITVKNETDICSNLRLHFTSRKEFEAAEAALRLEGFTITNSFWGYQMDNATTAVNAARFWCKNYNREVAA